MPTSNFLIFDQNKANMIGDEAYQTSTQRLNGVQSGVASSMLNNKFAYQVSLVAYAIAQIMNQNGIDATDTMAVSQFVNNLSSTFLQKVVDKASVADAVAASSDSKWMSPKTVKSMLQSMGSGWKLLGKWEVAGTYTWTAPDLLGNGHPYEIGILLIGGGGSGGVVFIPPDTSGSREYYSGIATSAASNNRIISVTPGQQYSINVAQGTQTPSGTSGQGATAGNPTSAFGIEAIGALVGQYESEDSDNMNKVPQGFSGTGAQNPFGLNITIFGAKNGSSAPSVPIWMGLNPYNGEQILGCGGGVYVRNIDSQTRRSAGGKRWDGKGATDGGVTSSQNATLPGCSAGACGQVTSSTTVVYTPGKGADGACYIYVPAALK